MIKNFDETSQYILIIGGICGVLFVFVGFIRYKKSEEGDEMGYISIAKFVFQTSDLFTDLFFNVILYLENELYVLIYVSISLLLLSSIGSILSCLYWIIKWNKWQYYYGQRLREYLRKYSVILMGLTIISNFYVSVDVLRSKFFYLKIFYLPLTKEEHSLLDKYRFFNIVILENISQFIIQSIYLSYHKDDLSRVNSIVFISMAFSMFSICLSTMGFCMMFCRNQMENNENNNSDKTRLLNKYLGHKSILDGSFIIHNDNFHSDHAFTHDKIASCLETFLLNQIDQEIR